MTFSRRAEGCPSPAFEHAQRVQLAGAAEGDDQQEAADEAADHRRRDDPGGDDDGAALLVAAVAAVVLRVTNPRLKDTAVILQEGKVSFGFEAPKKKPAYPDEFSSFSQVVLLF